MDNRSEPSLLGGDVRLGGFPRNNHYHTNRDDADGRCPLLMIVLMPMAMMMMVQVSILTENGGRNG